MGNRILDMNQISESISKHTVCCMCSDNEVNSAVLEKTKDNENFIDFVENYELEFIDLLSVARKGAAKFTPKRKGIRQLHGKHKKQKAHNKAAASTAEKIILPNSLPQRRILPKSQVVRRTKQLFPIL